MDCRCVCVYECTALWYLHAEHTLITNIGIIHIVLYIVFLVHDIPGQVGGSEDIGLRIRSFLA